MVIFDRVLFAKLLCSSLSAFIISSSCAFASDTKEAEDPALKKAVSLYGSASYSQAITEFDKLANSKQSGDIARYYRALCYQQQKQYKAARDEYLYLYYKAQDKTVRYKSWQALKTLPKPQLAEKSSGKKTNIAKQDGPGSDAWVMPGEGYGHYGESATYSKTVTIIPTSCGRRR